MISTKFISNCTRENIDELKIASLYFDKIDIINNYLIQVRPVPEEEQNKEGSIGIITSIAEFVTEDFRTHVEVLINEGIAEVCSSEGYSKDKLWESITDITNKILSSELEIIFLENDVKRDNNGKKISANISLTEEAKLIHRNFIGPLEIGKTMDLGFLIEYYSRLLSCLLFHISKGDQSLSSSNVLNKFLLFYSQSKEYNNLYNEISEEYIAPNLIMDALKLAVPNISAFPFDDVLETREKAESELLNFRNELEIFQFNLLENYSLGEIHAKSSEIIKYKLNPNLKDLKRKIEGLNLSLPKIVFEEFKNPGSYIPLMGSLIGNIPAHIATLLSLGLITLSAAYDYVLKRKELKANGLYYLIDLGRKFGD